VTGHHIGFFIHLSWIVSPMLPLLALHHGVGQTADSQDHDDIPHVHPFGSILTQPAIHLSRSSRGYKVFRGDTFMNAGPAPRLFARLVR
jgi:hypothetical protein